MRDVTVVGAGMTEFGEHEANIKELVGDACYEALATSGVDRDDIEYAACGNYITSLLGAQGHTVGQLGLREVGITGIPVNNISNGGATGAATFRDAYVAVASGAYDVAFALGAEKMSQADPQTGLQAVMQGGDLELEVGNGMTAPGIFSMIAQRRMHDFDTTHEQMAQVAVNHHHNATKNPNAQLPMELTVEEVLEAPMVADPLTLYESCPTTDGAAAVILASEDVAEQYSDHPVDVTESVHVSGTYDHDVDISRAVSTKRAADAAYERSGLTPDDVDFVEIHDAFSIEEIIYLEELGFCDVGEGGRMVEEGRTKLDGEIPFAPSGGLIGQGHPLGATGIAQIAECFWQLRGEAGERQVPGAEVGMTHLLGTNVDMDYGCIVVNLLSG